MQILPLDVNREQLRRRTDHADLRDFEAYMRQRVRAAAAPDYFQHNAARAALRMARYVWRIVRAS